MKTLHLLRHAKSSWDAPELSDHERGLNRRGERDAALMGAELSTMIEPMAIAVSPATRARRTLERLCEAWPALAAKEHIVEDDLYTFSGHSVLDWIASQDPGQDSIFVIGHNPALTAVINTLAREYKLANLPTAGYVRLALDIDHWDQLMHCVAVLEHSLFPKQLK
jgi:phosphohistidine phosphatase